MGADSRHDFSNRDKQCRILRDQEKWVGEKNKGRKESEKIFFLKIYF